MDLSVRDKLAAAGFDVTLNERIATLPTKFDVHKRVQPVVDGQIALLVGDGVVEVRLKPASELFTGTTAPPDFSRGPTREYAAFFWTIEGTALDYCQTTGQMETDEEFHRLYRLLSRRPDGRDAHPLFSYIQAAARLYLSLRDASRAEFEAVTGRLALSARHFSMGPTSRNYIETLRRTMGK